MADSKFEHFKKLVIEHLEEIESKEAQEESGLKKSLLEAESMAKGGKGLPIGTIRDWKGRKYIKVAPGKWRPKYDGDSRGARLSIAALKRKAEKCKSSEELLQLILENRDRFSDKNGRPLPFVKELSDYVSNLNDKIEGEAGKPEKTEPKKGKKTVAQLKAEGNGKGSIQINETPEDRAQVTKNNSFVAEISRLMGYGKKYDSTEDAIKALEKHKESVHSIIPVNETLHEKAVREGKEEATQAIIEQLKLGDKNVTSSFVDQNAFTLDDIRHIGDGKETKRVEDMETANKVIKMIAQKYGATEKGRKELSDFIALNIGGTNPLFDKIYEEYGVSYEDLDMDFDACHDLILNRANGKDVQKQREQIADSKSEFEEKIRQMAELEDKGFKPDNSITIKDIRKKYESSKSVEGNKKTVTLPDGSKIKCHYKLVEAEAPTASHDETTFAPSKGFPTTEDGRSVNDRDYQNDADAQESVRKIAANFNSLALESPPIVTKDGIVVSGNNRTMSSKLAARNKTDTAYLADLKDMADEYGFEEKDLEEFKNPRLVLEVDNEHEGKYTTEEFAKFNRNTKKTMSNVEKAVKLTKTLNESKIQSIAQELTAYDTMSDLYQDPKGCQMFVGKLIEAGIIGDNEKAQYLKSDGTLNDTGKDFVETVLVGSVLNEGNIRKLDGAGGKRIRQKLVRAILPLIENKGNGKEYSFNKELNDAVDIAVNVAKNHDTYKTVDDYLAQGTLFGETKPDEITSKLAKLVHDEGEKAFAQRMKDMGAGLQASANGEMDIFLGGVESKQSLMERFLEIKKSVTEILSKIMKARGTSEIVTGALNKLA